MEQKPGWKTSEFWMSLLIPTLATALNQILGWQVDPEIIMGMFGFSAGTYNLSRGSAKKPANPLVVSK